MEKAFGQIQKAFLKKASKIEMEKITCGFLPEANNRY